MERKKKESRRMNGRVKCSDKSKPHSIRVWGEWGGRQLRIHADTLSIAAE